MRSETSSPGDERAMLPWWVVAGAFLHLALPAYLLAGLGGGVAALLGGAAPARIVAAALPFSLRFAGAYGVAALLLTLAARLLDPVLRRRRRRRRDRSPHAAADASRRRLAAALAAGRAVLDAPGVATLDAIRAAAWDHDDPRFQAMSADLARVMTTARAAIGTAPAQDRPDLAKVAAATLARIAAAAGELADDRHRLDRGDLLTMARYIDGRYPPLPPIPLATRPPEA